MLPTIWDRLAAAGLSGRYYFSDAPFLGLWGPKYSSISRTFDHFLEDCAAGTLPQVSYVDPRFIDDETGTSNDDHRDANANNLALALDFGKPDRSAPVYAIDPGPFGLPCPAVTSSSSSAVSEANEWAVVRAVAQSYGWAV